MSRSAVRILHSWDDPHRLAEAIGQATAMDPDPAALEAWFAAREAVSQIGQDRGVPRHRRGGIGVQVQAVALAGGVARHLQRLGVRFGAPRRRRESAPSRGGDPCFAVVFGDVALF